MEGYLWTIERTGLLPRPFLVLGGALLVAPEIYTDPGGLILAVIGIAIVLKRRRVERCHDIRIGSSK
jgi:hypothetical protein